MNKVMDQICQVEGSLLMVKPVGPRECEEYIVLSVIGRLILLYAVMELKQNPMQNKISVSEGWLLENIRV